VSTRSEAGVGVADVVDVLASFKGWIHDQQFPASEKTPENRGTTEGAFVKLTAEQMFHFGPFSDRMGAESRT
jgi:hypothetical protein